MVENIDFHDVMPKIDAVIAKLDKSYLDDILKTRATIENIAVYILKELSDIPNLFSVIVWEGLDKYVEITESEIGEL